MGLCWSESSQPVEPSRTTQYPKAPNPTAPPYQQYATYNPNYTYAVKPQQQQVYYSYPQQMYQPPYQQTYPQYPPQQYLQQQPQQQRMGTGTALATGFILGAVVEDMLDPME